MHHGMRSPTDHVFLGGRGAGGVEVAHTACVRLCLLHCSPIQFGVCRLEPWVWVCGGWMCWCAGRCPSRLPSHTLPKNRPAPFLLRAHRCRSQPRPTLSLNANGRGAVGAAARLAWPAVRGEPPHIHPGVHMGQEASLYVPTTHLPPTGARGHRRQCRPAAFCPLQPCFPPAQAADQVGFIRSAGWAGSLG